MINPDVMRAVTRRVQRRHIPAADRHVIAATAARAHSTTDLPEWLQARLHRGV